MPATSLVVLRFPKGENANGAAAEGEKGEGDNANNKAASPPPPATAVMQLVVGCLVTNDPKKSSAGSFEVSAY